MKLFTFLKKREKSPASPLWSKEIHGETLHYHGEDIPVFLQQFDRIEDKIISLWDANKLTWENYQQTIFEVQEARRLFVRFAYN